MKKRSDWLRKRNSIDHIQKQTNAPQRHQPLGKMGISQPGEIHAPSGHAVRHGLGDPVRREAKRLPGHPCDAQTKKKGLPRVVTHGLPCKEKAPSPAPPWLRCCGQFRHWISPTSWVLFSMWPSSLIVMPTWYRRRPLNLRTASWFLQLSRSSRSVASPAGRQSSAESSLIFPENLRPSACASLLRR